MIIVSLIVVKTRVLFMIFFFQINNFPMSGDSESLPDNVHSTLPTSQSNLTSTEEVGKTGKKRVRTIFSNEQLVAMENEFHRNKFLTRTRRIHLSLGLNLNERQIKIWFQNRRTKHKKEQKQNATNNTARCRTNSFSSSSNEQQKFDFEPNVSSLQNSQPVDIMRSCQSGYEYFFSNHVPCYIESEPQNSPPSVVTTSPMLGYDTTMNSHISYEMKRKNVQNSPSSDVKAPLLSGYDLNSNWKQMYSDQMYKPDFPYNEVVTVSLNNDGEPASYINLFDNTCATLQGGPIENKNDASMYFLNL